jgi:hypothetical protein
MIDNQSYNKKRGKTITIRKRNENNNNSNEDSDEPPCIENDKKITL